MRDFIVLVPEHCLSFYFSHVFSPRLTIRYLSRFCLIIQILSELEEQNTFRIKYIIIMRLKSS